MSLSKPVKISILAAIVILLGSGAFWFFTRSDEAVQNEDSINYGPPTETEISETEQHKEELTEELSEDGQSEAQANSDNKRAVAPIISFSEQQSTGADFEVNGYVPGIVERNGSCTAILTKGNETVEKEKVALDDAQSTSCGLIVVPRNELSAGDWSLSLRYESPYSAGLSETVTVTIN